MSILGRLLFYILWPLVWMYAPLTRRSRAVVIHEGKILLVKNLFGPGYWQLPGGGIKMGESVMDAAKRELKEELGLKASHAKELHEDLIIHKQFGLLMRYHFVDVDLDSTKEELTLSRGLTDASWVSIDDLEGVASEVIRALNLVSEK